MTRKTTLNIDSEVMRRLQQEAARRGTTISALVESALRPHLDADRPARTLPPLPSFDSGGHLVNVDDRDALYRAMERR